MHLTEPCEGKGTGFPQTCEAHRAILRFITSFASLSASTPVTLLSKKILLCWHELEMHVTVKKLGQNNGHLLLTENMASTRLFRNVILQGPTLDLFPLHFKHLLNRPF